MSVGQVLPRVRERRHRWLLPLGVALLFVACKGATIPDQPPYVTGAIERILPDGRIHVAGEVGESCGSIVTVGAKTAIQTRQGRVLGRSALYAGRRVSVWVSGPVLESCPTQSTARFILVDPD